MTQRLLLHVGYHKTATTWMQRLLFTPAHGYHQLARHDQIFEMVAGPHGLRFDPGPMRRLVAEAGAGLPAGGVPVLSSELLCGNPFFGGRESEAYAERLKAIAPEARILISSRAQLQALPSIYMQYLSRGGTMSCRQFFEARPWRGYFTFDPAHFEYDRLVGRYQDLFGAENVYVLTQESLRADLEGAAAALARFCGNTDYRGLGPEAFQIRMPSYPEHAAPALRRANHLQGSVLNPNPVIRLGQTPGGL